MLKTVGNPATRYGNQTILDGNLVIGTAGNGIDFSADPNPGGMTSELLDDYEEGTWTPAFSATVPGNSSWSYITQSGFYTKVGRLVQVSFALRATLTKSTLAGDILVMGLPFTVNATPVDMAGGSIGYTANFPTPPIGLLGRASQTTSYVLRTSAAALDSTDVVDGGQYTLRGTLVYFV